MRSEFSGPRGTSPAHYRQRQRRFQRHREEPERLAEASNRITEAAKEAAGGNLLVDPQARSDQDEPMRNRKMAVHGAFLWMRR